MMSQLVVVVLIVYKSVAVLDLFYQLLPKYHGNNYLNIACEKKSITMKKEKDEFY